MKKGFVYILGSEKDGKTYTGSTINLRKRLEEHNKGLCRSTKNRVPLTLIHSEEYDSLTEARRREKYLKSSVGRKQIKEIIDKLFWGVAKR